MAYKTEEFTERVYNATPGEHESARAMSKAVNVMAHGNAVIGALMANDHATLQQSFMGVVVGFLEAMAAKEYTDDRNEASADFARQVVEAMADHPAFMFCTEDRFPLY